MKNNYLHQFDYELWANELTINAIKLSNEPDERVFQLISHIVASHSIWLSRIKGEKPGIGGWDLMTLDECLDCARNTTKNWSEYLNKANTEEFERQIHFKLLEKDAKISVKNLIIHLISHSAYHRGQIIARLKGKLEPLPLTTYIAYAKNDSGNKI